MQKRSKGNTYLGTDCVDCVDYLINVKTVGVSLHLFVILGQSSFAGFFIERR